MKIVIEDYYGNDLCSLVVYNNHEYYDDDVAIETRSLKNCDIADKDTDEEGNEYIRIQLTSPFIADKV